MAKFIILAYANDKKKSLTWLEDENNTIQNYFLRHNLDDVRAIPLQEVDLDKFSDGIKGRSDDTVILHFSGHSDGNGFYFQDQKAWVQGISGFASKMKNLHFVFLNGCANKPQVESFHKAGVKAVIATSRAVDDKMASWFSKAFYSGLCKHMTLGAAFDHAVNEIKSRSVSINFLANARHFATDRIPDPDTNDNFPWGIYYNKDSKGFELWTLPQLEIGTWINTDNYRPTTELVEKIAKHASGYYATIKDNEGEGSIDKSIQDEFNSLLTFYKDTFRDSEHHRKKLAGMVKNMLPFPVAARFERMLSTAVKIERKRGQISSLYKTMLTAQFDFYFTMTKLCGLTMLSELYEFLLNREREANPEVVTITKDQHRIISQFFEINEKNKREFDFASLIKSIREMLESNRCNLFIQEYLTFKDHFSPDGEIFEAHIEISSIRNQLDAGIITDNNVVSYVKRVEELLWKVLEKVYFIMRYKLASIKRIEIIKYRFSSVSYNHNRIILHRALEGYGDDETPDFEPDELESKTAHTDSHSVLLFRGLSDVSRVLNITPFIVDINMLKGNEEFSLLYMFSYFNVNGAVVLEEIQSQKDQISFEFDEKKDEDEQLEYVSQDSKMRPMEKKNLTRKLKIIRNQYLELKSRLEKIKP